MTLNAQREILNHEVERLRAAGYDVYVEPGPRLAPAFAEGFQPDAVAIGEGRKIALEVVTRSQESERRLGRIAGLFKGHPDWELRVVWAEPAPAASRLPVQSRTQIDAAIAEIRKLQGERHFRPSFLLGWAAFEAAARAVAEAEFGRPQTPGRLVEVLSREGYLTPDEADAMRALTDKRNRLAHGALDVEVDATDVDRLVHALEAVAGELAA